jgi:hypothetical protein
LEVSGSAFSNDWKFSATGEMIFFPSRNFREESDVRFFVAEIGSESSGGNILFFAAAAPQKFARELAVRGGAS